MSSAQKGPVQDTTTFAVQLEHELQAIEWARCRQNAERHRAGGSEPKPPKEPGAGVDQGRGAIERAHDKNLLGLAFSGGGIRSATFNLGVIQRLAQLRLLHRFDYLSTVSGGGYIGGWLSAWVQRERGDKNKGRGSGILGVEQCLRNEAACEDDTSPLPEPRQVRWLREFSNYLTPRVGALSTDTLTGVATYLRNLILNQSILIAFGASLLVLPWVLVGFLLSLDERSIKIGLGLAALLVLIGSCVAGYETLRADLGRRAEDASEKADAWARRAYWILFCSFTAAAVIAGMLVTYQPSVVGWWWAACFGGAYGFGTSLGWWVASYRLKERAPEVDPGKLWLFRPVWALVAGVGLGGLLLLWAWFLKDLAAPDPTDPLALALPAVALGPLVLLGAILLTITLHLGLTGRKLREAGRELWSSHGAHQMRFAVIWLVFAFSSLFGPLALMLVDDWIAALGGATWLLTTLAGVLAGSGSTTGGRSAGKVSELIARIAPYVFVLGILLMVSFGAYRAIWWQWHADGVSPGEVVCEPSARKPIYEFDLKAARGMTVGSLYEAGPTSNSCRQGYMRESAAVVKGHGLELFAAAVCLFLAALFLSWRVDINVFSFHMFYRNRIERCYMGASNLKRRAHPLTGLDPTDAPKLQDLALEGGAKTVTRPDPAHPSIPIVNRVLDFFKGLGMGMRTEGASERVLHAQRPFPIINTALNITSARNLAWQERKAASFTFSPMYCGYEIQAPDGKLLSCYQSTADYVSHNKGWISLGLPITVSGAAASPNAGYHTSAATAFLMTVFNVRLGWWLQNPRYRYQWQQPGPKLALSQFLHELFGMTTDESSYVYLSDGGHFENLGIYELVRRRCRYIIACDAGCDPQYGFEDLGNAVRKCQVDFGISIDIDPHAIRPDSSNGRSGVHCAVGRIHYEQVDKDERPGYLLYLKSSLTGNEPVDILQYAAEHSEFPHEATTDQWYGESQFESYRKLGFHVAGTVLADAISEQQGADAQSDADLEEVFTALSERWYPPSAQIRASFSKHGEMVESIFERVGNDEALGFLDQQIYPEWWHLTDAGRQGKPAPTPQMLPENAAEIRAGFYLCNSLLQLMESVYHDLNLEEQYGHPDNRGWMNLFRHWSWAGMLRVTWAISASMYGARFQRFCRRRLDLEVGKVSCGGQVSVADLEKTAGLNILETDHVGKLVKECFRDRKDSLSVVQLSLGVIGPFEEDKGMVIEFPFAFALIDNAKPDAPELLYYRVRDHLRGIGLGRKGLAVLLESGQVKTVVALEPGDQDRAKAQIHEVEYPALWHLWSSVVVAKEERGREGLDRFV